ncbi:FUSC family protein [Gordonia sp. SND2]|uniref:FUSC family protein n=1 Tax=Gordonia sp. SND2 TaxID=3388659 RepID=UPI00398B5EF8
MGHAIRSGAAVGVPFIVGALTDHIVTGMWIGLACLLLAAGEREGTYRLNFTIIAVSTPIAAAGYILGYSQDMPLVALAVLMAMLALLMGLLAGLGPAFSVGGMQFLLTSSIAIGVDGIHNWWVPLGLYCAGAALYAVLLGLEALIVPDRPQRKGLQPLLEALAELARARHGDLLVGGAQTTDARIRTDAAYYAARDRLAELPLRRRTRWWSLTDDVLDAAEGVQALLVGEEDPDVAEAAARRLEAFADGITRHESISTPVPVRTDGASALTLRIDRLQDALTAPQRTEARRPVTPVSATIDSEVIRAAVRLALCFGIAVGAKWYFPFSHWFWVPLTVCLVMKPDFGSVFSRAILRIIGTLIGAGVATVIIVLVPKGVGFGIAILLISVFIPWLMMRSYSLQAVAITPVVILLVAAITPAEQDNYSAQRIAATAIGGAVVIVFGYLLWPHSRRVWVHQVFAEAMGSIATELTYAGTPIPRDDAGPVGRRHDGVVRARRAAAASLTELSARLHRALAEPPPSDAVAAAWLPAVDAAQQLADEVARYAADRLSNRAPANPDGARDVADAVRAAGRIPEQGSDPRASAVDQQNLRTGDGLGAIVDRLAEVMGLVPHGR